MKFRMKTKQELIESGYKLNSRDYLQNDIRIINEKMLALGGKIIELKQTEPYLGYTYTDGEYYYSSDMLTPIARRNLPEWF